MFDYFIHSLYTVINTQRGRHTLKSWNTCWTSQGDLKLVTQSLIVYICKLVLMFFVNYPSRITSLKMVTTGGRNIREADDTYSATNPHSTCSLYPSTVCISPFPLFSPPQQTPGSRDTVNKRCYRTTSPPVGTPRRWKIGHEPYRIWVRWQGWPWTRADSLSSSTGDQESGTQGAGIVQTSISCVLHASPTPHPLLW